MHGKVGETPIGTMWVPRMVTDTCPKGSLPDLFSQFLQEKKDPNSALEGEG